MRAHPSEGVKGSKPRLTRLRKVVTEEDGEVEALNRQYLISRNRQMEAKSLMALREARLQARELLEAAEVIELSKFYVVALRQSLLRLPQLFGVQFKWYEERQPMINWLDAEIRETLSRLARLPEAVRRGEIILSDEDEGGNNEGDKNEAKPAPRKRTARKVA